jgi:hypothetical protein
MEGHRLAADPIDQKEVSSKMTLRESSPINTTLAEAVLSKSIW